jgi:CDP-6-deoxy-D-xylo-4-hexulose-3-dehydrase
MKKYKWSYGGALIGKEEKRAIMKVVDRNWWPLAEEGEKMEKEAAKFLGVKYGILANSGSSACLLALAALELPKGSEVIIPATTFPTVFNAIVHLGLTPVVVDSKVGSYNLDPEQIPSVLSKKTKAVIAVHAVGNPVDMVRLMEIAKEHNLYVLEDNCDGWGGTIRRKRLGSFGHLSFTSFHAAHIVAMGQGGGVFTNDSELARKVRMYRDWGRQSDIKGRTNNHKWPNLPKDQDARFIYEVMGWNLSPLELQAAMGRVQLRKTPMIKARRKANYQFLLKELSKFDDLIMPVVVKNADPSWFAFPVTTVGPRAPLVAFLEKSGVETRSIFGGNILKHPAYEKVEHREGTSLSEANFILEQSFWLPVHPRYTPKDLQGMVDLFKAYYAKST